MNKNVVVVTSLSEGSEILASLRRRLAVVKILHLRAMYFWCMIIVQFKHNRPLVVVRVNSGIKRQLRVTMVVSRAIFVAMAK